MRKGYVKWNPNLTYHLCFKHNMNNNTLTNMTFSTVLSRQKFFPTVVPNVWEEEKKYEYSQSIIPTGTHNTIIQLDFSLLFSQNGKARDIQNIPEYYLLVFPLSISISLSLGLAMTNNNFVPFPTSHFRLCESKSWWCIHSFGTSRQRHY